VTATSPLAYRGGEDGARDGHPVPAAIPAGSPPLGPARRRLGRAPGHRAGGWLIGTGALLLALLGAGLLAVSFTAQYRYLLAQRHQVVASLIEAAAPDVGLIIFSVLALGLAMTGLAATTERAGVVLCAVLSAVMNYSAAHPASIRSVLAFVTPPIFLAFVVDRVVSTMRRHMREDYRSPWAALAGAAARMARFTRLLALYMLRFLLAAPSTCQGVRRYILDATPLPAAGALRPASAPLPAAAAAAGGPAQRAAPRGRGETKTSRFLKAVNAKYGEFSAIPPQRVSAICTELAPTVGLDCGAARKVLREKVLAAQAAREGDIR
jgi:hypothetical protein